ncbi:MAG: serine/threonine-protein kinase [Terriglobia bacterium]
MKWLSDQVLDRLQATLRLPDLSGTRYRTIRYLARGGMSTVWLAEDTVVRRRVALKILDAANDSVELGSRLLREARILARLEHPGIVPVHDAGTLADGRVFYCMKYVEGQRLDHAVRNISSLPERLRLLERIAEPLAFAHSKGILHRDLKPENIMIGPFGEVLVMDWGVAKVKDGGQTAPVIATSQTTGEGGEPGPECDRRLDQPSTPTTSSVNLPETEHGRIFGTPGYMSPEQTRGDSVDERTDVFSLGAILNFMLSANATGQAGSLPQVGRARPVPRPLQAICAKATAFDPASRYPSIADLSADLARYLEGLPVTAYRENFFERAGRVFARHRVAIVLVAAYLLMRLLLILFSRR